MILRFDESPPPNRGMGNFTHLCIWSLLFWSPLNELLCRFVSEEHLLEVEIEPGMMDGMEHKFHSEGEPHMDGEPGDLILNVRTYPHNKVGSI